MVLMAASWVATLDERKPYLTKTALALGAKISREGKIGNRGIGDRTQDG